MLLPVAYLFLFFSFLTPHVAVEVPAYLSGSNTFEIKEYSVVKQGIAKNSCIRSDKFFVGPYEWTTEFYPHGWDSSCSGVSIAVRKVSGADTVAISTHRLRDWKASTWSTKTPWSAQSRYYSPSTAWGQCNFMSNSDLEASNYLSNNTLLIMTTLWVYSGSYTSLPFSSVQELSPAANFTTANVTFNQSTENLPSS